MSGAEAGTLGAASYEPFKLFNSASDRERYLRERRNDWLSWKGIAVWEEYVRGRIDVVICVNAKAGWRGVDRSVGVGSEVSGDRVQLSSFASRRVDQNNAINVAHMHDRGDNSMLVTVVESVKTVENTILTRRVSLKADYEVLSLLSGCYHSSRRGFKIYPRVAEGELSMAILCSTIPPDQLPYEMIKNTAKVVNTIAQNETDFLGHLSKAVNANSDRPVTPTISLSFDGRSVWARVDKGSEDLIEVTEVLIGPF
jgi:hypothetical protein